MSTSSSISRGFKGDRTSNGIIDFDLYAAAVAGLRQPNGTLEAIRRN